MLNRLSRYGLLLVLSVALGVPAAYAQAPRRERIAIHPCVITGARKPDVSDLEAVCATAAIRETMNLVPSTEVRAFLEKERGSCAKAKNRNACLGRLAAATRASYTLYITLNPFTPKSTRITGLVVDDEGRKIEEKPLELPRIAKQPPSDVVRFAVSQLIDQLDVVNGRPQEGIAIPPSPGAPPEPEPVAVPSPDLEPPLTGSTLPPQSPGASGGTWKTSAGIISIVAGGALLFVSATGFASVDSDAKEFNDAFKNGLPPQSDMRRLALLRDNVKSGRKAATIAAGVGGALAVGGALLWMMDGSSSSKSAPSRRKARIFRLLAGPGQVGLSVPLP